MTSIQQNLQKMGGVITLLTSSLAISTLAAQPASALVNIIGQEIGNNVQFSYSGSLDISNLNPTSASTNAGVVPAISRLLFRNSSPSTNISFSNAITGPASFGSGNFVTANSSTGDVFAFSNGASNINFLAVPINYISGTNIAGSVTFNNRTFATLGVTPGTYTYNLTNNIPNNDIILNIGVTPIPFEFSPVVGVSLLGGLWLGRKVLKRKKSK